MVPFGNFGWNFGFGFGWILVLVTVVLIIAGIIRLARVSSGGRERQQGQQETALDILKRRYANGEITKQEFEEQKKDILDRHT